MDDQKVTEIREWLLSVANHAMIARDRVGRLDYVDIETVYGHLRVADVELNEVWAELREATR